jgi:hypothetical protein
VRERFKPRNINLFDPAAQEYDWDEFLQQSTPKSKRNYVPKSTLFRYRGNSQSLGRALATNTADGNHEPALLVPRSTTKRTLKMCNGQLATARSSADGRSSQCTTQHNKRTNWRRQNHKVERQRTKQNGGRWIHARSDRAGTQHASSRLLETRTPTGAQEENKKSQTELGAGRGKTQRGTSDLAAAGKIEQQNWRKVLRENGVADCRARRFG